MTGRISRREAIGLAGAVLTGAGLAGCRRRERPGMADVPPEQLADPGAFRDVSPRWSHDGQRIAFLRERADRRYQLFTAATYLEGLSPLLEPALVNPDRPVHAGRCGLTAPDGICWSPDDGLVAFPRVEWFHFEEGDRVPGTAIWSYDLTARKTAPLSAHPREYKEEFYYFRSPQFSPDGRRLTLMGESPTGATALILQPNIGGGATVESVRPDMFQDSGWPAWSPDGRSLAFRQGILRASTADAIETLRLISPGGMEAGKLFALSPTDFRTLGFDTKPNETGSPAPRFASPAWSPDGKRIAFTIAPDAADRATYAVYVMSPGEGRLPLRISPPDGSGYLAPVWIDEERIGAVRPATQGWDVVELSSAGGVTPRVLAGIATDDFDWSPDRKRIVCASERRMSGSARGTTLIVTGLRT